MQPNFALSLSFDGIKLMHRVKGGWHLLGEVPLDAKDLEAEIAVLRRNALALEPRGLRVKILLPNEQIRYISLDNTRAQDTDVRAALDGATPYALDELVYDFAKGGGRTHIAAIARETLDEAEAFANGHKFSPVCFAAIPEPFTFPGEVFFGATSDAHKILGAGEKAERDETAVRIIGRVSLADLRDEPVAEASVEAPAPEAAVAADVAAPPASVDDAKPEPAAVAPEPPQEAALKPEPTPEPEPQATPVPTAEPQPPAATEPAVTDAEAGAEVVAKAEPKTDPLADDKAGELAKAAPDTSGDKAETPTEAEAAAATGDETVTGADPKDAAGPGAIFASRARPSLDPSAPTDAAPRLTVSPAPEDASGTPAAPPMFARRSAGAAKTEVPEPAKLAASLTPSGAAEKVDVPFRRLGAAAPAPAADKPEPAPQPKPISRATPAAKPAKRAAVRGKPRYLGLILTGLLLLFLVLVAIFAAQNPDSAVSRLFGGGQTAVAEAPAGEVTTVPIDEAPAQAAEAGTGADAQETETAPAASGAESSPLPDIAATLGTGQPVSEAEAQRIYAATRVWVRDPRSPVVPRSEGLDAAALAAPVADPVLLEGLAALSVESSADVAITAPLDPLPAGTTFQRDARGFILATPEGTRLPSGILVMGAAPPLVPPPRPGSAVAPETAEIAATDAAVAEALATLPETADITAEEPAPEIPTVSRLRPPLRPEPPVIEDTTGALDSAFASETVAVLRPRARPADYVPSVDAEAIADALEEASLFETADALRPEERPADMAAIVASASSAPEPEPAPTTEASYQPPQGPTPGGVAAAATIDNAIALRDISLVAIVGTSNGRYALVRLSANRIEKVEVGDRLDGGTVTAISATQLIYQKRGQNIVLEMPSG